MKKVGLALSGGSAYGFAHIGVLKVLVKNKIPIDVISGTSMGALIGGMFASGIETKDMEKYLTKLSKNKVFDFNPFVLTDNGLLFGKKVIKYLKKIIGDKNIEDCKIKYCAIASELSKNQKYVFDKGDMVTAIRASTSVPGFFKPVKIGDLCLVDGGMHDNFPVEEARKLGADVVIGVDVCSYYKKQNDLKRAFDIVISAFNIMTSNSVKMQKDKGDIYIKIDQPKVKFDKFSNENALKSIKMGEKYAKKALPEIKRVLGIK